MNGVKTESNWPWILRNAKDKEAGSARDIFREDSTSDTPVMEVLNVTVVMRLRNIIFHNISGNNIFQVCTRATRICQCFQTIG